MVTFDWEQLRILLFLYCLNWMLQYSQAVEQSGLTGTGRPDSVPLVSIPVDPLRRIDIAELRAHMSQLVATVPSSPEGRLCRWLYYDEELQALFKSYEDTASGSVSLSELVVLANAAFEAIITPGHTLAGTSVSRCMLVWVVVCL